jgi:hypothetical protein
VVEWRTKIFEEEAKSLRDKSHHSFFSLGLAPIK